MRDDHSPLKTSRVLVTGANGFVGSAVVRHLQSRGISVVAAVRADAGAPTGVKLVRGLALTARTDWTAALDGTACVVHAAARVHLMRDTASDPMAEFRRVNVEGTLALARQAATAGVTRFVFLSSVKVNGEATAPGEAFRESDVPSPKDAYGMSKLEAEAGLRAIAEQSAMEVTIIRPVLVYGPGVRANFALLANAVARGWPLPLGSVQNLRSMIALDNLTDLIALCIDHPQAAQQVFLASDGEDLSTADIARRIGAALGRPARLLPVPVSLLKAGAALVGRAGMISRLCDSLSVDIGKARSLLDWQPPLSVDEGLRRMVAAR